MKTNKNNNIYLTIYVSYLSVSGVLPGIPAVPAPGRPVGGVRPVPAGGDQRQLHRGNHGLQQGAGQRPLLGDQAALRAEAVVAADQQTGGAAGGTAEAAAAAGADATAGQEATPRRAQRRQPRRGREVRDAERVCVLRQGPEGAEERRGVRELCPVSGAVQPGGGLQGGACPARHTLP